MTRNPLGRARLRLSGHAGGYRSLGATVTGTINLAGQSPIRLRRQPISAPSVVIGSPATLVSGKRTVRVMTVSYTVSPNTSTTRAITSRACRVRASNMVTRMPVISSFGVEPVVHLLDVSLSRASPRRLKYSHSIGMITPSAQASALTVSSPREGWQSMRM